MPRSRGGSHRRGQTPASALSTCNLPADIIADILSRLPVKTLMRFRCVCKPWISLFTSPKFIAAHHARTKVDDGHTLLVHSRGAASSSSNQTIYLLHTKNPEDSPLELHLPFPPHDLPYDLWRDMEIVGSVNGLVCLNSPPLSPLIALWNPATKQYRYLPYPNFIKLKAANLDRVSIGFAFDYENNDYKVIRVVCFKKETGIGTRAEVYSANAGTWRKIDVDLPFFFCHCSCVEVVKGVPYWIVHSDEDSRVLVLWFDVGDEVFGQLEVPQCYAHSRPVNYKDSLHWACVVPSSMDGNNGIEVTLYTPYGDEANKEGDGGESFWSEGFTVGPMVGVESVVGCSKNGEIVAENSEGKLVMFDLDAGEVKKVRIRGAQARSFEVFSYSESLGSITGSVQAGKMDKRFGIEFDRKVRRKGWRNRYRSDILHARLAS